MTSEFSSFDLFVDDILESDENLLKGELDFILMQYLFNSLELKNIDHLDTESDNYIAA